MLRHFNLFAFCICLAGWFSSGVLPHSLAVYQTIAEAAVSVACRQEADVAQKAEQKTTADRQKPEPQPETIVEATGLHAVVPMSLPGLPQASFALSYVFHFVDYRPDSLLVQSAHLTLRLLHNKIFGAILTNAP